MATGTRRFCGKPTSWRIISRGPGTATWGLERTKRCGGSVPLCNGIAITGSGSGSVCCGGCLFPVEPDDPALLPQGRCLGRGNRLWLQTGSALFVVDLAEGDNETSH